MGTILRNGIAYGGGGVSGSDIEVLTQEAYDALVAAGTVDNDKYYFIEDGEGTGNTISIDVLDTMAEINVNTESDKAAGALAVKELNNSINDKLVVSSTRTEFTSTKDTTKERARILGTVTNGGSPYLGFGHYPANSSDSEDLIAFHYDGTSFKVQGIKDGSETVTKTIATTDDINALRTSFQDGCSTIAATISEMGVTTASNASLSTIVENIKKLQLANRRPWEIFATLGGVNTLTYEDFNGFIEDTSAVAEALSVNDAVDYLVSNTTLFNKFLNNVAAEMTESSYCLSQIKSNTALMSLLFANSTALEDIKTNSSAIKTVSKSLSIPEGGSSSKNTSFTVDGLLIYCDISSSGEFWGYDTNKGGGKATSTLKIGNSNFVSASASGNPGSGANYKSYSGGNRKYNTTITSLSHSCTLSLSNSPTEGTSLAKGSTTVYYL